MNPTMERGEMNVEERDVTKWHSNLPVIIVRMNAK